jgi:hypothetical protein
MTASRADMMTPPERTVSTFGYALCGLSVLLLACQVWLIAVWLIAVGARITQSERAAYFLNHLPFSLGQLGAFNVTVLSAAVGVVGAIAGLLAARGLRDTARRVSVGGATANAVLVVWYLFTMM